MIIMEYFLGQHNPSNYFALTLFIIFEGLGFLDKIKKAPILLLFEKDESHMLSRVTTFFHNRFTPPASVSTAYAILKVR